ncbi:putative helicase [Calothrix sp. PCC 7716]|nr:putative helicase [Calothrix sp. PCC 7716]
MPLLTDYTWATKYDSDTLSLIKEFYEPALSCAVRYDRSTGFFSARILTLAAIGIESLIRNNGVMRLIIGCTLREEEVQAIARGEKLREVVDRVLSNFPLAPENIEEADALELLSWMIANGYLEVKLALPCSLERQPIPLQGIFHEKAGIIEDKAGNRLAFNGSVNETARGWTSNWESFHAFTDWGGAKTYVDDEERGFAKLWANQAKRCLVIDVPTAVKEQLLSFLPPTDQKPKRLMGVEDLQVPTQTKENLDENNQQFQLQEQFKQIWRLIQQSPAISPEGDYIGEATCAVIPYPHQINAFQRLYQNWPPKLLIADEVGLGKTIQAGLLIRQAWLAGKAKRILILAPKAVLTQWQIELREKFNLNVPIYDGKTLTWYDCPALRILDKPITKPISRTEWHFEPIVITSSHLMRRVDRARELIHSAEPYDLIFLDEAHHARRQGVSSTQPKGANQLLKLMQQLKYRTKGLVLLTATPMQVSPIEVWDLLDLLDLPQLWNLQNFQDFFKYASTANPSHSQFEMMARLFRAVEAEFGETSLETAQKFIPNGSKLATKKVLQALRDKATLPRKQLSGDRRRAAIAIMRSNTPVNRMISRHTRELLRRYYEAGKISSRIANRLVEDKFVSLTPAEKQVYEAVEDYISSTYNNASQAEKNAVGFVMTIYRRRLASSFAALERTLNQRVNILKSRNFTQLELNEENISDDEADDETMDSEQANELEKEALQAEEVRELEYLLKQVQQLPTDTKTQILHQQLQQLKNQGYKQVIIFTQYTDTMDFLRQYLLEQAEQYKIICFSGRGGEQAVNNRNWRVISRDDTKRIFREGKADILLCTDAAAEGLNFQFCGALINYDMPWNPMRVEQRIGRIDRLGQIYENIKIINLHYSGTVETDVYLALRERIGLFSQYVGKLQPILATLPRSITNATLSDRTDQQQKRATIVSELENNILQAQQESFDLDTITEADLEEPARPQPTYDLNTLDQILQNPSLLPPGIEVELMQNGEYKYSMPGMKQTLRVTTKPDYFDQHPGSTELWAPGSPLFPIVTELAE